MAEGDGDATTPGQTPRQASIAALLARHGAALPKPITIDEEPDEAQQSSETHPP